MPTVVPFAAASATALGALALLPRLHRGYVGALEEALRAGAVELAQDEAALDATTRKTLTDTTHSLDRENLLREIEAYRAAHLLSAGSSGIDPKRTTARSVGVVPPPLEPIAIKVKDDDPRVESALALLSGDNARMRAVLEAGIEPRLVRLALPIVADRTLGRLAEQAIEAVAAEATGALEDALVDGRESRALRARVPALLVAAKTERARDAILRGLDAESMEVRLAAGRALAKLARAVPELAPSKADVCDLVAKALERAADEGRTARTSLRPSIPPSETTLPLPAPITARLDPVIVHALTLLTAFADPEALGLAGRALAGTDAAIRGTALKRIGSAPGPIPAARRSERELVEALYKSRAG
jgi:hypothetical protein